MGRGINAYGAGQSPAVASAQKERPLVRAQEELCHRERSRRLAGAADREIAETDDWNAGVLPL